MIQLKMDKKGRMLLEVLIISVIILFTVAAVLLLVKYGFVKVAGTEDAPVLTAEFLPFEREGSLVIKDFKFCSFVDESYTCLGEGKSFVLGSSVYFRFAADSSVYNGEIKLVENYQLKDPEGKVVLEADQKDNFYFDTSSNLQIEEVIFKDSFVVGIDMPAGTYTLDLLLTNPLLNKNIKLSKEFEMK